MERRGMRAYMADCSSVVQFLSALATVVVTAGGLWVTHDIWHTWRQQAVVTDSLTRPPIQSYPGAGYAGADTAASQPRPRGRPVTGSGVAHGTLPATASPALGNVARPPRLMQTALVDEPRTGAPPASAPASTPAVTPVSAPVVIPTAAGPAPPASHSLAKGTEIVVQPTADVCDAQLKRGAVIGARLAKDVATSDGGVLAAGTPVRVEVVERRVASGDQEPVISLEATSLQTSAGTIPVESRTLHFVLEKPGVAGTVVKGTIIGALGGAALGLVLRQNVGKAALIGGAAGGAIGAARASTAQACIAASSTTFPFTLAQATEVR